jgi:hypothetical protein
VRRPLAANARFTASFAAALLATGIAGGTASAQSCPPGPNPPPPVVLPDTSVVYPANPADVSSIEAIVAALYNVISGPAGQKRDWNRFMSLFVPGARLIPTRPCPGGGNGVRVISAAEYAARGAANLETNGFFERGIATHTDTYGDIAQVFTTYESRHTASDPTPFARGINSMQFFYDGKRWWCVTIFWDQERPGQNGGPTVNPIPQQYLPK